MSSYTRVARSITSACLRPHRPHPAQLDPRRFGPAHALVMSDSFRCVTLRQHTSPVPSLLRTHDVISDVIGNSHYSASYPYVIVDLRGARVGARVTAKARVTLGLHASSSKPNVSACATRPFHDVTIECLCVTACSMDECAEEKRKKI